MGFSVFCVSVNTCLVNLENHCNDLHKIWNYMYFGHEKTIQIGFNLVKNGIVCLSVRERNSHKSRGRLKRFSQNKVLHTFRVREDDLDRSQSCKKLGCLSVNDHNSRKCTSISKKFKYILKYHSCSNPIEIGERSICSFFQRNAQKNAFTLQYRDKNNRISLQIVYENYVMLQKITIPIFLWETACIKSMFGNSFAIHGTALFFFLIHYQMKFLSIFQASALNFMYFDFNRLIVITTYYEMSQNCIHIIYTCTFSRIDETI